MFFSTVWLHDLPFKYADCPHTGFVNLTVCAPIAYYYDRTIPGGSCKNQVISGTANAALSFVGDIAILILPLPMIWTLQMNIRRKLAVTGIFLLGSLYV